MDARKILLTEIDHILVFGGSPGRILVFGRKSEAVLTAASEGEVIIAAAELGRGRIAVGSHQQLGENFHTERRCPHGRGDQSSIEQFQENLKTWLTKGRGRIEPSSIGNVSDGEIASHDLGSYKILFWNGDNAKVHVTGEQILEFVKGGGGFFHCVTPWNWVMSNKTKAISDIPYCQVLVEAGLCYTNDCASPPTTSLGYSIGDNKAADAHFDKLLQDAVHHMSKAVEQGIVEKQLKMLPKGVGPQLQPLMDELFQKCGSMVNKNPISKGHEAKGKEECGCLGLWLTCADILDQKDLKAPGIHFFPGDFDLEPPLKCFTLEFHSHGTDFYFTGCYAIAGKPVKVTVDSGNKDNDWRLLIGCHSDRLSGETLRRWPTVVSEELLKDQCYEISSLFGGTVYLLSPQERSSIKLTLENVVEAPRFDLEEGKSGREAWKTSRLAPGLWADMSGKFVTITLPSSSIRDLENPDEVMKVFDDLTAAYHDFRGTDITKERRQWIVPDVQPSVGYMHAGYPVVTMMDVADPKTKQFLANPEKLHHTDTGSWPIFHEIAHNMQRSEWTFEGTLEVSNNIFSLFATEKFCGEKPWECHWLRNQVESAHQYLEDGASFEEWKENPGVALFIYAQLARDFGWASYRKVFHHYESMSEKEKPKNDQDKIDFWFTIFSKTVKFNLTPLVLFWGIPLSTDAVAKLQKSGAPHFLPDDEMTQGIPSRTDKILKKFPNIVRTP